MENGMQAAQKLQTELNIILQPLWQSHQMNKYNNQTTRHIGRGLGGYQQTQP